MAVTGIPNHLKIRSDVRWDDANGLFIIKLDAGEDAPAAVGMTKIAAQITLDLPFATVAQCIAAMETRRSAIEDRINAEIRHAARAKSAGIVFFTKGNDGALKNIARGEHREP